MQCILLLDGGESVIYPFHGLVDWKRHDGLRAVEAISRSRHKFHPSKLSIFLGSAITAHEIYCWNQNEFKSREVREREEITKRGDL